MPGSKQKEEWLQWGWRSGPRSDHAALRSHVEDFGIYPTSKGVLLKGSKPYSDAESLNVKKIPLAAEWRRDLEEGKSDCLGTS